MLDLYDDSCGSHDSYIIKKYILSLSEAMKELNKFTSFAEYFSLLPDTGTQKRLCCISLFHQAGWSPVKTIQLRPNLRPFKYCTTRKKTLHRVLTMLSQVYRGKYIQTPSSSIRPPFSPYIVPLWSTYSPLSLF